MIIIVNILDSCKFHTLILLLIFNLNESNALIVLEITCFFDETNEINENDKTKVNKLMQDVSPQINLTRKTLCLSPKISSYVNITLPMK